MKTRYMLFLIVLAVVVIPTLGLCQDPHIEMRECLLTESGVLYYIWVCAGADAVNDFEICLFDEAGNELSFVSISAPPCWYPHASGSCGYWYTEENPILPGECMDEFDFKVPPGSCHILVRWMLTFDGVEIWPWTDTWIDCDLSDAQSETWGAIKSLYR
jgi:hypothetical protein